MKPYLYIFIVAAILASAWAGTAIARDGSMDPMAAEKSNLKQIVFYVT
jgi:hypothetical protein